MKATEYCCVAVLHKEDYLSVMQKAQQRQAIDWTNFLMKIPMFQNLKQEAVEQLIASSVEIFLNYDNFVFKYGDQAKYLYIVYKGDFEVVKQNNLLTPKQTDTEGINKEKYYTDARAQFSRNRHHLRNITHAPLKDIQDTDAQIRTSNHSFKTDHQGTPKRPISHQSRHIQTQQKQRPNSRNSRQVMTPIKSKRSSLCEFRTIGKSGHVLGWDDVMIAKKECYTSSARCIAPEGTLIKINVIDIYKQMCRDRLPAKGKVSTFHKRNYSTIGKKSRADMKTLSDNQSPSSINKFPHQFLKKNDFKSQMRVSQKSVQIEFGQTNSSFVQFQNSNQSSLNSRNQARQHSPYIFNKQMFQTKMNDTNSGGKDSDSIPDINASPRQLNQSYNELQLPTNKTIYDTGQKGNFKFEWLNLDSFIDPENKSRSHERNSMHLSSDKQQQQVINSKEQYNDQILHEKISQQPHCFNNRRSRHIQSIENPLHISKRQNITISVNESANQIIQNQIIKEQQQYEQKYRSKQPSPKQVQVFKRSAIKFVNTGDINQLQHSQNQQTSVNKNSSMIQQIKETKRRLSLNQPAQIQNQTAQIQNQTTQILQTQPNSSKSTLVQKMSPQQRANILGSAQMEQRPQVMNVNMEHVGRSSNTSNFHQPKLKLVKKPSRASRDILKITGSSTLQSPNFQK